MFSLQITLALWLDSGIKHARSSEHHQLLWQLWRRGYSYDRDGVCRWRVSSHISKSLCFVFIHYVVLSSNACFEAKNELIKCLPVFISHRKIFKELDCNKTISFDIIIFCVKRSIWTFRYYTGNLDKNVCFLDRTLAEYLASNQGKSEMEEREILIMFQQMVSGIRHVHDHMILHRWEKLLSLFKAVQHSFV